MMLAKMSGWKIAIAIVLFIAAMMAVAVWSGPQEGCAKVVWFKLPGCAIALYENLSGGLIAAGGALFAGWLAWSAVSAQIDIEREKLKSEQLRTLQKRAEEISSEILKTQTALMNARQLLQAIQVGMPKNATFYASRLRELEKRRAFPVSFSGWQASIPGHDLSDLVLRMKDLGQDIERRFSVTTAEARPGILAEHEAVAAEAVSSFEAAIKPIGEWVRELRENLAHLNSEIGVLQTSAKP